MLFYYYYLKVLIHLFKKMASVSKSEDYFLPLSDYALSDTFYVDQQRQNLILERNNNLEKFKIYSKNVEILLGENANLKAKLANQIAINEIIISERRQLGQTVSDQRKALEQLEAEKREKALLRAEIERLVMI